jgi:hypothetical protein
MVSVFRGRAFRTPPVRIDSRRGLTGHFELRRIASKPIRLRLEITCVLAVGPVLAPASLAKNGTSQATALRRGRADYGVYFTIHSPSAHRPHTTDKPRGIEFNANEESIVARV